MPGGALERGGQKGRRQGGHSAAPGGDAPAQRGGQGLRLRPEKIWTGGAAETSEWGRGYGVRAQ